MISGPMPSPGRTRSFTDPSLCEYVCRNEHFTYHQLASGTDGTTTDDLQIGSSTLGLERHIKKTGRMLDQNNTVIPFRPLRQTIGNRPSQHRAGGDAQAPGDGKSRVRLVWHKVACRNVTLVARLSEHRNLGNDFACHVAEAHALASNFAHGFHALEERGVGVELGRCLVASLAQ